MTGPAPSDLVRQMRLLIAEEAYLWDLTEQMNRGPWSADDCRQVLARWFECGLIDCIATAWATRVRSGEVIHHEYDADWRARATENGQFLVLAREDARALLTDPATWRPDGPGAGVMLCESDEADGLPFDAWFDQLAGLPDHLLHGRAAPRPTVADAKAETIHPVRRWMRALDRAANGGPPLLCPVNGDADIRFDGTANSATPESIDDIVWFVDREGWLPFGRHRLWCPGCGAEQYVVVTPRPA